MKTAVFWKAAGRVFVFSQDCPVEAPLNIADYPFSHIEKWNDVRKSCPELSFDEYDDHPRGRLIWDDGAKTYFFYADEKILSDPAAVDEILRRTGLSRNDFTFRFCRDAHYRTP